MKKPRVTGDAVIPAKVRELIEKFEYPVDLVPDPGVFTGGGGGMAHILIVSTSEPTEVQDKADYIVPSANSSSHLQEIFDYVDVVAAAGYGIWTIWMAGQFQLNSTLTAPTNVSLRGLGWTEDAPSV